MTITMNMSSYEIEHDPEPYSMEAEYGAEIMCAGWNPAVDLLCQQQLLLIPTEQQTDMPTDLTAVIAELFLEKMYTYQR